MAKGQSSTIITHEEWWRYEQARRKRGETFGTTDIRYGLVHKGRRLKPYQSKEADPWQCVEVATLHRDLSADGLNRLTPTPFRRCACNAVWGHKLVDGKLCPSAPKELSAIYSMLDLPETDPCGLKRMTEAIRTYWARLAEPLL